jgi:hypothetical protein
MTLTPGGPFLKTLVEACQKTSWQAHAYCLMRNHFYVDGCGAPRRGRFFLAANRAPWPETHR